MDIVAMTTSTTNMVTNYTFKYLPDREFQVDKDKDIQEYLRKWSMKGRYRFQSFAFDQPFAIYKTDQFLQNFMMDPEVIQNLQIVDKTNKWSPVGVPALRVVSTTVPCSETSMNFFTPLETRKIHIQNGTIKKCLSYDFHGFPIEDELRKLLLLEESENYDAFTEDQRKEFLFLLLRHICLGGELCQWEDDISPYMDVVKTIYKDLISVSKDPNNHIIRVTSFVFKIIAQDAAERIYYPAPNNDNDHPQTFCYVIIDPRLRHVNIFYHRYGIGDWD